TKTYLDAMGKFLSEQSQANNLKITKSVRKKGYLPNGHPFEAYFDKSIKQQNLKRGDFINLNEETIIPADILLLNSSLLVDEYQLTGEEIIVSKVGLKFDHEHKDQATLTIHHHKNEGSITIDEHHYPYTSKNMLFRGTKIVDGHAFLGLVIETGNDCH